ncbi:hypothetical protein [Campylobacter sputorum]|uniref:hypothetical protein n=1 Tax=Campylobacter sputorum TaxID=206 RepID=UPI000B78DF79|nr:hypothetical protein [Campylobacter sputorum]ASM36128.1 hypothetical protein CSF_0208 [Campylobacter sputorum bv. faecalis CCUG 20703]
MASISEFIISFCELVEAQTDEIRYSFEKSAKNIIVYVFLALLSLIGFIFLIIGIDLLLQPFVGMVYSKFITAIISFAFTFILYKVLICKHK